jgi:hypothetical protein
MERRNERITGDLKPVNKNDLGNGGVQNRQFQHNFSNTQ